MSEAVKSRSIFATPAMSAESQPEMELVTTPVRWTGFVALALGLSSFVAILGSPLIVIPILAGLLAFYAIRPYTGERPVGFIPALIGLFFAALFGVWSVTERQFRNDFMGTQATRFAHDWLTLMAHGDLELALELQIHPSRRQPESMPLIDYYQRSEAARNSMIEFKKQNAIPQLIDLGMKPKWELAQPVKIYTKYGRELTQTVWRDGSGGYPGVLKIELEYLPAKDPSSPAEWKIELVGAYVDDTKQV